MRDRECIFSCSIRFFGFIHSSKVATFDFLEERYGYLNLFGYKIPYPQVSTVGHLLCIVMDQTLVDHVGVVDPLAESVLFQEYLPDSSSVLRS